MRRIAAVVVTPGAGAGAPPGVDRDRFRDAVVEDTYEVLAGLDLVHPAVVVSPPGHADVVPLTWPGTPVLELAAAPGRLLTGALRLLAGLGADQAAVVAADAPDLPPLLVAKLFRGLGTTAQGRTAVAACPAGGGGLVALAARLPLPGWFDAAGVELDDPGALGALAGSAPDRAAVHVGPGWHRLRAPEDIARLDAGLEGWPATRALLAETGGGTSTYPASAGPPAG